MLDREQAQYIRRLLWTWADTPYFIRRKEEEIAHLRAAIDDAYETLGAQNLSGMPNPKGGHKSSVERAVEAAQDRIDLYEQVARDIQDDIEKALKLKRAIDETVDELSPTERKVLEYRYKERHQWDFIGLKMNYHESRVKAIERSALEMLENLITFEVKTK